MLLSLYKTAIRCLRQFTVYLRLFSVFAAAIILLMLAAWCFWWLPQGVDIIVKATETKWSGIVVLLMLFFWAYVNWYSGRIVAYRKDLQYGCFTGRLARLLITHLPRILGYLCFAVIALAILQCPVGIGPLGSWLWALLGAHFLLYIGVSYLMNRWGLALRKRKKLMTVCTVLLVSVFVAIVLCGWLNTVSSLVAGITWIQYASLFLVNNRGKLVLRSNRWTNPAFVRVLKTVWNNNKKNNNRSRTAEEALLFVIFNVISVLATICYLTAIFYLPFANHIGSFPFALLALGVLLGFFNIISISSMLSGINVTVVYIVLLVIIGFIFEPHYARIIKDRENNIQLFDNRQHLEEYFIHWVQQRQAAIQRDSIYPVFFVLADGGASRSGYWTAAVLSRLEEGSNSLFSKHLLCLSGASGGSVGNTTFFTLLQKRDSIYRGRHTLLREAQDYLKSDFLTYTLARMMGPDLFRPVFPFPFVYDRAAALEYAIENAAPDSVIMRKAFEQRMSGLAAQQQDSTYTLPILCINTTRMQDGAPGVVSNINIDSTIFGKRIDVLSLLKPGEDMRLSTAVVLGARFPYVSPAGRIHDSYFVDGGYFDNSGAGVVHEMILKLNEWVHDSSGYYPQLKNLQLPKKLRWYVIHITNSSREPVQLHKVHPLVNDLLAPVQTLIGSYGTQTIVNNLRLINYLHEINKDTTYFPISLYEKSDSNTYAMNWAISDTTLRKMNDRLYHYPRLDSLIKWIRYNFNLPAGEVSELRKEI